MIQALFGLPDIALRTMEVYTTATLEALAGAGAARRRAEWRACMERLRRRASARAIAAVVYEHPRFIDYFRGATPEAETGARSTSAAARRAAAAGRARRRAACARSRGSSRGRRRG